MFHSQYHCLSQFSRASFAIAILSFASLLHSADSMSITLDIKDVQKIAENAANDAVQKALLKLKQTEAQESTKVSGSPVVKKGEKQKNSDSTLLMRIGSGSVGGNYFVLGAVVGGVISHPVGSLRCGNGGTCGVPNLQMINMTSAGSMANLNALNQEKISSGFVQSDIAYWAYTGTGLFKNKGKMSDLRAIASLYPEAVHIVVNKKAGINSIADLKGKRVSVGARKSGTLSQARLVLGAYHLNEDDLQTEFLNNQQSIKKLKEGDLDAMFFSVGPPAPALTQLFSENNDFSLLSINDSAQQKIFRQGAYFSPYKIEKNTYPNIGETSTISVFALWLCSANLDEGIVYKMTKALWSDASRQLLDSSYIGLNVRVENSLQGIGIPLHEGAKKYYNQIGKRY